MIRLSGFGDEVGPDIEEQMKVFASENERYIELRSVSGTNILEQVLKNR